MARALVVCLALLAGAASAAAAEGPVVVGLLVDTSRSIGAPEMQRTRALAQRVLSALPPGSEVAIYTFDDDSRLVLPRTASAAAIGAALQKIDMAGRHTALHDALYDASRDLEGVRDKGRAILLVTDGKDEDSALNLEDGLERALRSHIPVFTVGVGNVQERVLRRIAKLTGGTYERATAPSPDLARRIAAAAAPAPPASQAATTPADEPDARLPGAVPSPGPANATPTPAAAAAADPAATTPRSGRSAWWIFGLLLVGLVGLAALALRSRRSDEHRCERCSRPLAGPLSNCVYCGARDENERRADAAVTARRPAASEPEPEYEILDDPSPTVIDGMNHTEEFLEKTITLRERPVLMLTSSTGVVTMYDLRHDSATAIGRSKANDIIIQDVTVSSQHCRIRSIADGFEVLDLRSTNGTFVNEHRVQRHPLKEGDTLRLGDVEMRFRTQHSRG